MDDTYYIGEIDIDIVGGVDGIYGGIVGGDYESFLGGVQSIEINDLEDGDMDEEDKNYDTASDISDASQNSDDQKQLRIDINLDDDDTNEVDNNEVDANTDDEENKDDNKKDDGKHNIHDKINKTDDMKLSKSRKVDKSVKASKKINNSEFAVNEEFLTEDPDENISVDDSEPEDNIKVLMAINSNTDHDEIDEDYASDLDDLEELQNDQNNTCPCPCASDKKKGGKTDKINTSENNDNTSETNDTKNDNTLYANGDENNETINVNVNIYDNNDGNNDTNDGDENNTSENNTSENNISENNTSENKISIDLSDYDNIRPDNLELNIVNDSNNVNDSSVGNKINVVFDDLDNNKDDFDNNKDDFDNNKDAQNEELRFGGVLEDEYGLVTDPKTDNSSHNTIDNNAVNNTDTIDVGTVRNTNTINDNVTNLSDSNTANEQSSLQDYDNTNLNAQIFNDSSDRIQFDIPDAGSISLQSNDMLPMPATDDSENQDESSDIATSVALNGTVQPKNTARGGKKSNKKIKRGGAFEGLSQFLSEQ